MSLKNFKHIFKFTTVQLMKGKAFKISTTIILAAVFIVTALATILPVVGESDSAIMEEGIEGTKEITLNINKVYLKDSSNLNIDIINNVNVTFPNVKFEITTKDNDSIIEELKTTEEKVVFVSIDEKDGIYNVNLTKPLNEELVSDEDAMTLVANITAALESGRLINAGVSPDKLQTVLTPMSHNIIVAGEEVHDFNDIILDMILPMILCMVFFYIIYFYGYWVANSIVSEKTSRVMELLLTSVKPMELIVGKCVGMGSLAIAQFTAIVVVAVLSNKLSIIFVNNVINTSETPFDVGSIFAKITPINALFIILFFIFGYILYSVFNALVGATISKIEDLNSAMMPVSFLSIIGFYLAYMGLITPGIGKVALYVPFSSPFYIPAKLVTETIPIYELAISLLILLASVVLFIVFTSRVYSVVILHMGNRLKIKDLFNIFSKEK